MGVCGPGSGAGWKGRGQAACEPPTGCGFGATFQLAELIAEVPAPSAAETVPRRASWRRHGTIETHARLKPALIARQSPAGPAFRPPRRPASESPPTDFGAGALSGTVTFKFLLVGSDPDGLTLACAHRPTLLLSWRLSAHWLTCG